MNKEMERRLETLVSKNILVSIYTDTDDFEAFTLGYLLQMDDDNILINMIDSFGEENGFCIINLEDIFIFGGDKMYIKKMETLFKIKNQKRRYIEHLELNAINSFLMYSLDNKLLIKVNEDDNYIGYVSNFSSEILVLQIIDNYGNDLGTATIDIGNVNTLKCQDRYLKDMELLYSTKNSNQGYLEFY